MTTVTIDLPGKFDSDFSGSSVGQGQTATSGYDGAALLYAAYKAGREIKRGKGYSLRLTLTGTTEEVTDALYCLFDYADTFVATNGDDPEYRAYRAAGDTMRRRAKDAAAALGADVSDWRFCL
jgi:hypothetical protein